MYFVGVLTSTFTWMLCGVLPVCCVCGFIVLDGLEMLSRIYGPKGAYALHWWLYLAGRITGMMVLYIGLIIDSDLTQLVPDFFTWLSNVHLQAITVLCAVLLRGVEHYGCL